MLTPALAPLLAVALLLAFSAPSAHAASISVLYKRDSETSLARLDPAAQAALQAMEERLIDSGLEVIQPKAALYALLDAARGVVLNFSDEAGLTMTLDAAKGLRPNPGADSRWAEVRLRARIYSGARVLASFSSFGAVAFRGEAQERAFEVAAKRAVDDLGDKLLRKLDDAAAAQAEPAAPAAGQAAAQIEVGQPAPPAASAAAPAQNPPAQDPADVRRISGAKWALMIGVSDFTHAEGGESGRFNLPGVEQDMRTVRKALTDLGVEPARLLWLYNEKATTRDVRAALQTLQAKAGPDDLVYVYFSSHGLPKTDGLSRFGIPVTYDYSKSNFIDFEQIRAALGALPARDIIWVNDTCHSGLAAEGLVTVEVGARDFGVAPPSAFDVSKAVAVREKNIAVISSAAGDQQAVDMGAHGGLFSSVFSAGAEQVAASSQPWSIYTFYKQYVDGKVQAEFHQMCGGARPPAFCSQGSQQPVFGAQQDGKRIGM
jgi:hypothetical protein